MGNGMSTYYSYYDGQGSSESSYKSEDWYSQQSSKDNGYNHDTSYYQMNGDYGSSYYEFYDGINDYRNDWYYRGSLMSQSDKDKLVDGITQAVANTIGKIALDSISMKSEHKSEYRSQSQSYATSQKKGGNDAFNWGWLALALFGSSAVYCGFQAVRSRKTDDSFRSEISQPAYDTNVRSVL